MTFDDIKITINTGEIKKATEAVRELREEYERMLEVAEKWEKRFGKYAWPFVPVTPEYKEPLYVGDVVPDPNRVTCTIDLRGSTNIEDSGAINKRLSSMLARELRDRA